MEEALDKLEKIDRDLSTMMQLLKSTDLSQISLIKNQISHVAPETIIFKNPNAFAKFAGTTPSNKFEKNKNNKEFIELLNSFRF